MPRPAPRPTIRDVASAAGVSATTVSHALNGKGRVDESTRDRIRRIATEVGYVPNPVARSLRSGRTFAFGLSLPELGLDGTSYQPAAIDWYGRVALGCSSAATSRDHALLLLPGVTSTGDLHRFPVDGVVVLDPEPGSRRLQLVLDAGLPTVTVGCDPRHPEVPSVDIDHETQYGGLLSHLREQGARRVLFLSPRSDFAWTRYPSEQSERWSRQFGLELRHAFVEMDGVLFAGESNDRARTVARPAIEEHRPDAVVATMTGWGAMLVELAGELALRVPDDLMVAQHADGELESLPSVSLTAVDLRPDQIADLAVGLLHDVVALRPGPRHVQSPVTLQPRRTTRSCGVCVA